MKGLKPNSKISIVSLFHWMSFSRCCQCQHYDKDKDIETNLEKKFSEKKLWRSVKYMDFLCVCDKGELCVTSPWF